MTFIHASFSDPPPPSSGGRAGGLIAAGVEHLQPFHCIHTIPDPPTPPLPSHPLHAPSPPPLPDPRGGATSSKTIPQSRSLVEKQPACKSGACSRCTVTHVSNPPRPPVGGPTADYTTHLLHAACPRRWAPRLNYQQQFGSSLAGVTGCKRSAVLL